MGPKFRATPLFKLARRASYSKSSSVPMISKGSWQYARFRVQAQPCSQQFLRRAVLQPHPFSNPSQNRNVLPLPNTALGEIFSRSIAARKLLLGCGVEMIKGLLFHHSKFLVPISRISHVWRSHHDFAIFSALPIEGLVDSGEHEHK